MAGFALTYAEFQGLELVSTKEASLATAVGGVSWAGDKTMSDFDTGGVSFHDMLLMASIIASREDELHANSDDDNIVQRLRYFYADCIVRGLATFEAVWPSDGTVRAALLAERVYAADTLTNGNDRATLEAALNAVRSASLLAAAQEYASTAKRQAASVAKAAALLPARRIGRACMDIPWWITDAQGSSEETYLKDRFVLWMASTPPSLLSLPDAPS